MELDRLRSLPLFRELSDDHIEKLSNVMKQENIAKDKFLAFEGDFAYRFFIIEDGRASVSRKGEHLRDLGPGDFFGEVGVLESERRTASVIAETDMRVLVLQGWDLRELEEEMPALGQEIRSKLRERLSADEARGS